MSALFATDSDFDRCLLVDDTVDDVTEILTVLRESTSSRGAFPETFDMGDVP